jgi:hypothetical protein
MLPLVNFPIYGSPDKTAPDGRFWTCPDPNCLKSFRQLNGVIAHYNGFHLATKDIVEDEDGRRFRCPFDGCTARSYQNSNGLGEEILI